MPHRPVPLPREDDICPECGRPVDSKREAYFVSSITAIAVILLICLAFVGLRT